MAFALAGGIHDLIESVSDDRADRAELVELAGHRDPRVRAAVAARQDCPLAAMLVLAHDRDRVVGDALTSRAVLPDAVLAVLAEHPRRAVRSIARKRLDAVPE